VHEIEIGHDVRRRDRVRAAAWCRPCSTAHNRGAIRALFEGRLERPGHSPFWATGRIDDGVLRVDVPEVAPHFKGENSGPWGPAVGSDYVGGLERLPEVLPAVLALARRLQAPEDVPRRLADNLKTEPVAGVRLQVLVTLTREFPDHPATREALLAGREDPDADVRLQAGIALGPEGREVLLAIAGGEGALDETAARAVAGSPGTSRRAAAALLHNALRTRRVGTARPAWRRWGHGGGRGGRRPREARRRDGRARVGGGASARDDPRSFGRGALLRALFGRPRPAPRAAMALGRVNVSRRGAAAEAEAGDSEMRRTARQAIAEIQSRLTGAAPGQLSLAGGSRPAVLAEGEEGRLSLTEPVREGSR
jgi:hypothetical protein